MTYPTQTDDRQAAGSTSYPDGFDATRDLAYENAMSRFVATGTTCRCQAFPAVTYLPRSRLSRTVGLRWVSRETCDPTHAPN